MKALLRYRIMAYIVGVGLILVVAGIPLQVLGHPGFENVIGVVHGIFYIVYLFAAYGLYRTAHFTRLQLVGLVCAGFVPLLAFYMERRTTKRIERDLAALEGSGVVDPGGAHLAGDQVGAGPGVPVVVPPEP